MIDDTRSNLTGSTSRLLAVFQKSGIECEIAYGYTNTIRYKTVNDEWRLLKGMLSEKLPLFSKLACDDKWWTHRLFAELNLPSPETVQFTDADQLDEFIDKHKTVVVKPRYGAHGHGVSMNLASEVDILSAIKLAKKFSTKLLAQQQISGMDIRLLVIGRRIVSAVERRPATVIGDGAHAIEELIHKENKDPRRGKLGIDTLVAISLPAVKQFLTVAELGRILANGETVRVVGPSNQSMGGTVHDITDRIPNSLRDDTLRLTSHLKMPIAGVDCILTAEGYSFLEINASPGIAIHDDPELGIVSGCFKSYMRLLHEDTWWRL